MDQEASEALILEDDVGNKKPLSNVLPFRKKGRDLDAQFLKPDPFTDRVATMIKQAFDVPIISPSGIVMLNLTDQGEYELMMIPPNSYTPSRVILSIDQIYSLIHALDYVLNGK